MQGESIGPYVITRELGSGGMGTVYEARDGAGERVALKLVHPHLLSKDGFRERFLREIEVGRRIEHPNVVRTLDAGEIDGRPYVALEFVDGQTLEELLQESGRVPEDLCRHIGHEIARGLEAIHDAGIVHRDLKPGNVLITPEHVVKVMDLGLARHAMGDDRLSMTGMFVGTAGYAPPEQFRGTQDIDPRGDLYSLGALLYELATGVAAFPADTFESMVRRVLHDVPRRPGQLNPQLSPFFEELVLVLLAKNPEARLASASLLAKVLARGESTDWWSQQMTVLREETRRPLRRIRIPRETECVGRDAELAALRAAFDVAEAGDGCVVLLEGEAGIGKSRLIDELMRLLEQSGEDVNFLYGSYPPGGAATAAGAFTAAFGEQFGSAGSAPYLKEASALVPAFDALLRGDVAPEGTPVLTRDTVKTVFVHAARALCRERTTIIVIDDLHFAPDDGRALFASLAACAPGHRMLLVGTTRPGAGSEWRAELERQDHVTRTDVPRLDADALRSVVQPMVGTSPRAERLAETVVRTADGNPFFVFEIVRALRESGVIVRVDADRWEASSDVARITIPDSVNSLLAARLERLERDERDLLDGAACCGFEFDGRLVAEALGVPRLPALRAFGRLEREHGLVRAHGMHFVFDHHAILEHVRDALPDVVRIEIHNALGEALEARAGDGVSTGGDVSADICSHYLRGGRGAAALRHLDAALAHLENGYAHDRILDLIDRVLAEDTLVAGASRIELLLRKHQALEARGSVEERSAVLDAADALLTEAADPPLIARVNLARAALVVVVKSVADALPFAEAALGAARRAGSRQQEAAAHLSLAALHCRDRMFVRARDYAEHSITLFRTEGDRAGESRATAIVSHAVRLEEGDAAELPYLERALALARESGDGGAEFDALSDLVLRAWQHERDDHERLVELALDLAKRMGDRPREAFAISQTARLARNAGRLSEARRRYERCAALWRELGVPRKEAQAAWQVVLCRRDDADLQWALPWAERAVRLSAAVSPHTARPSATEDLHQLLSARGEYAEQLERFERHHSRSLFREDHWDEYVDTGAMAVLHRHLGRLAPALELARAALELAREMGEPRRELDALLLLAPVQRLLGRLEDARETLRAAARIAASHRVPRCQALILATLGEISADEGALRTAVWESEEALARFKTPEAIASIVRVLAAGGAGPEARAAASWPSTWELPTPSDRLVMQASLAWLPEGDAPEESDDDVCETEQSPPLPTREEARANALALLCDSIDRLSWESQLEARHLLWKVTQDRAHLTDAKRLLDDALAHAPDEDREAMAGNVRLHREVLACWGDGPGGRTVADTHDREPPEMEPETRVG